MSHRSHPHPVHPIVELGLLPANPADKVQWRAPKAAAAVSPQAVASPAQVQAILAQPP